MYNKKTTMKKIISLMLFLLISISSSCQTNSNFKKVEKSDSNKMKIEFAKELSDKILVAQKNGGFYKLTYKEAGYKMINGLNESLQKKSYEQIKNLFGDYKNLEFKSLMQSIKGRKYEIYRFIGEFESNSNVEIRTVLNEEGKLAGFFIKPWKDKL